MSEFEKAQNDGLEITLETGREVTMVLIEMTRFMERGEIPNELRAIAARTFYLEERKTPEEKMKDFLDRVRFGKWMTRQVVKSPANTDDFFDDEYLEVARLANNPAMALETFRKQQAKRLGLGDGVREVGADTKPTA